MKRVGVVVLGDMGSGLAKNLIAKAFEIVGFDLSDKRMADFEAVGGVRAGSAAEVGEDADAVFVMGMNGDQAKAVIIEGGLASTLKPGAVVLLTAMIRPEEARAIGAGLEGAGVDLVDSPVSGGFPGAQGGTLTMMASATDEVLARARPAMEEVSKTIHHVGAEPGMGQTVKACLQSEIGSISSATFEAGKSKHPIGDNWVVTRIVEDIVGAELTR
jgi:3-hydroxyisobutyrate dehydrogenase-like beta-hydroxyacid dehydrogenase